MKSWYVYRHIRLDKNIPFYIGIGCKSKYARAYEFESSKRNKIWNSINEKTDIEVEIIVDNLTKNEASIKEQEFIKLYGRIDNGTGFLCNLTDGGDGIWNCKRSEETKEKLRNQKIGSKNPQYGKKQNTLTKLKRSIALKGKKRTIETKLKQSLSSIISGQAKTTEVLDFKTKEIIGKYHSLSEACRSVGLEPKKYSSKASLVANGFRNQVKGYIFRYVN